MLCHMPTPDPGVAPRIIIADDDELLGAVVAHSLESHGYGVSVCARGILPRVVPLSANLVILDAHVPGEDFESAFRFVRSQSLPVLVLSGDAPPPAADDSGYYLAKPVDLDLLLETVARILTPALRT
jgi:DNA-binding response OmpR family regulator